MTMPPLPTLPSIVMVTSEGVREAVATYSARELILFAEIERLRAECEAIRADAERYRWLLEGGGDTYAMFVGAEDKAALDAAIDAARGRG